MADEGGPGCESRPGVLVVGGRSRSGQVFRRYAAQQNKFKLTTLVREPADAFPGERIVTIKDYFDPPSELLSASRTVVNFAGIPEGRSEVRLHAVNVQGPTRLASRAKEAGCRHFIQISSLHIYGYAEFIDRNSPEAPVTAYARSKQAADIALGKLASDDFIVTLLRMPMHYGRGTGGKLRLLALAMTRLGWFPVPRRTARRSVVHLDNLAAAIAFLVENPITGIQFVADPQPFTIEVLAKVLSAQRGRSIRVLKLPEFLFLPLRLFAKPVYRRLYKDNVILAADMIRLDAYPLVLSDGLKDIDGP